MIDHAHLVGKAAVETDKTHGSRSSNSLAKILRCHLHVDIAVVEPVVGKGRLDHLDRGVARSPDRHGADQ